MKVAFLLTILSLSMCTSNKNITTNTFQAKTFDASDGQQLLYNIYQPKTDNEKLPLLIFLHGAGERGNDNSAQLVHIAPILTNEVNRKKYPAILLFPQCPENEYWANIDVSQDGGWTPNSTGHPSPPMQRVIELIETFRSNPNVDTDRIYISGLSMGGFGTFDLLARHPDWFAGAIPICGGADLNNVAPYKNTPLWIFHGAKDPGISRRWT